jgi:hypothetical protein
MATTALAFPVIDEEIIVKEKESPSASAPCWFSTTLNAVTTDIPLPQILKVSRKIVNRLKKVDPDLLKTKADNSYNRAMKLEGKLLRARLEVIHIERAFKELNGIVDPSTLDAKRVKSAEGGKKRKKASSTSSEDEDCDSKPRKATIKKAKKVKADVKADDDDVKADDEKVKADVKADDDDVKADDDEKKPPTEEPVTSSSDEEAKDKKVKKNANPKSTKKSGGRVVAAPAAEKTKKAKAVVVNSEDSDDDEKSLIAKLETNIEYEAIVTIAKSVTNPTTTSLKKKKEDDDDEEEEDDDDEENEI